MRIRVLFDEAAVQGRVSALAAEIAAAHRHEPPLVIGILNGAVPFMMDLLKALPAAWRDRQEFDFYDATSYDGRVMDRAGLPGLTGTRWLAIRLGGRPRTLERLTREATRLCEDGGASSIETLEGADAADFWRKLADFGWRPEDAIGVAVRFSVPPSNVQQLVDSISSAQYPGFEPAVVAHPGYGNVMAYWFPNDGEASMDSAKSVVALARSAARAAGGSAIVERCSVETKTGIDIWGDVGGPRAIMTRLKEQYDPDGVLNPGRYVGGI